MLGDILKWKREIKICKTCVQDPPTEQRAHEMQGHFVSVAISMTSSLRYEPQQQCSPDMDSQILLQATGNLVLTVKLYIRSSIAGLTVTSDMSSESRHCTDITNHKSDRYLP